MNLLSVLIIIFFSHPLFANCLDIKDKTYEKTLLDTFYETSTVMQGVLCERKIKVRFRKNFLKKNQIGSAIPSHDMIMLKKIMDLKILRDKENLIKFKKNFIHELAHIFYSRVKFDKEKLEVISRRTKNGFFFRYSRKRDYNNSSSFDAYELKNKVEFFAVNTELFYYEPQYKCKRPVQYQYMRSIYKSNPFSYIDCTTTQKVQISGNLEQEFIKLDFSRFYRLDYLLASKSSSIMSRFGHSMIRIVFCSPKRNVISEKCLKDVDSHIVLSYRALIDDGKVNNFKGLLGGYSSLMYIYKLKDIIQEYTAIEKRNLQAYPVNRSLYDTKELERLVLDQAWSYRGKYKFISNNCATETLTFLQSFIKDKKIFNIKLNTPYKLLEGLLNNKIVSKNRRLDEVNYFVTRKPEVEIIFNNLKLNELTYLQYSTLDVGARLELIKTLDTAKKISSAYLLQSFIVNNLLKEIANSKEFASIKKDKEFEMRFNKISSGRNRIIGIPTKEEFEVKIVQEKISVNNLFLEFLEKYAPDILERIKSEYELKNKILTHLTCQRRQNV